MALQNRPSVMDNQAVAKGKAAGYRGGQTEAGRRFVGLLSGRRGAIPKCWKSAEFVQQIHNSGKMDGKKKRGDLRRPRLVTSVS